MDSLIITDRLTLRFVRSDDVDAIQRCILDPKVYEMVARIPANQPRKATEKWVSSHASGREADTDYVYAIMLEGEFIGLFGLHRASISKPFEIGYWVSPEAWGNGYITEAGAAVLRCLEDNKGPQKIVSGYFTDNLASGRVLEKLGFVKIDVNEIHCAGRNITLPHIIVERGEIT